MTDNRNDLEHYKKEVCIDKQIDSYHVMHLDVEVLTPAQINMFLQTARHYRQGRLLGNYVTRLIQFSYAMGNNEFVLYPGDRTLNSIGNTFHAKKERRPKIHVVGSACNFASFSKNVDYIIDRDAKMHVGSHSTDCNFWIYGNVGKYFALSPERCDFHLYGDVENTENIFGQGAIFCNFYSPHPEVRDKIMKELGNRFQNNNTVLPE